MAPKSTDPRDLAKGATLQCVETVLGGLPFEVWKTQMGSHRSQSTMEALRAIYRNGGFAAFYAGLTPKLVESVLKGGILLYAKESIIRYTAPVIGNYPSALIGGFGGGVAQVIVIGPCSFLVTAAVNANNTVGLKPPTLMQQVSSTFKTRGISGFYHGGIALTMRQGSNWASRQVLTELARGAFKKEGKPLSNVEEAASGVIGGILSTWNQPFEVLRIEAQSNAAKGLPPKTLGQTYRQVPCTVYCVYCC
jgi:hypothetical protein